MRIQSGVLVIAALAACAPRETKVGGDVFIVTKGRQNVKLGLVNVDFVPESEMVKHVAAKTAAVREAVVQTRPALIAARAEAKAADEAYKAAKDEEDRSKATLKALEGRPSAWLRYYHGPYQGIRTRYMALLTASVEKDKAVAAASEPVRRAASPESLMAGLPPAAVSIKTDAEGKFSVRLKPGKYGVVARASRMVGGKDKDDEEYTWFVWLAVSGEPEKRIMLSNDNQLDTNCADCIFKTADFAVSSDKGPETASPKQ